MVADLQYGFCIHLFKEKEVFDGLKLVYAFEQSKQFAGVSESIYLKAYIYGREFSR